LFVVLFLFGAGLCYPFLDLDGFSWAENLAFDGKGNLFVSDTEVGALYRIVLSDDGLSYVKSQYITDEYLTKIDGLTMGPSQDILLASARIKPSNAPWLIEVNTNVVGEFTPIVPLPVLGNGLAYYNRSGMVYTTYEGDFLPGKGVVYMVDIQKNQTTVAADGLEAADGCYIDQERGLLYISEVVIGRVICFQIESDNSLTEINRFFAPDMTMLDDMTLSADGSQIYAADYSAGNVVVFNADGTSTTGYWLMSDLVNPTSVRFESGMGFNSSCVYVTEGGGYTKRVTNRRVIQSPFALNIDTN